MPRSSIVRKALKQFDNIKIFTDRQLLLGRVIFKEFEDRVTVRVNLNRLNSRFNIYFPESENLEVYDGNSESMVGDLVVISKLPEARKNIETHKIQEVFLRAGFIVDPITGKRVDRDEYLDTPVPSLEEIKKRYTEMSRFEKFPFYSAEMIAEETIWKSRYHMDTCLGDGEAQEQFDDAIKKVLLQAEAPKYKK